MHLLSDNYPRWIGGVARCHIEHLVQVWTSDTFQRRHKLSMGSMVGWQLGRWAVVYGVGSIKTASTFTPWYPSLAPVPIHPLQTTAPLHHPLDISFSRKLTNMNTSTTNMLPRMLVELILAYFKYSPHTSILYLHTLLATLYLHTPCYPSPSPSPPTPGNQRVWTLERTPNAGGSDPGLLQV